MVSAMEMDKSSSLVSDAVVKDVEEVNTHTSESWCSSSSSTQADGCTSSATIMTATGVHIDSSILSPGSSNTNGENERVARNTRYPISPTPCGYLESLSVASAAASSARGAGTTETVMLTSISSVDTVMRSSALAPPPPIGFSGISSTPLGEVNRQACTSAETSKLDPPAEVTPYSLPAASASSEQTKKQPDASVSSFGGNPSTSSPPSGGLHPQASPFYPWRNITDNKCAIKLPFLTQQQSSVSPGSYAQRECSPSYPTSSSPCYEDLSALKSRSFLPPYRSDCTAHFVGAQGYPNASYWAQGVSNYEVEENCIDMPWPEVCNLQGYEDHFKNMAFSSPLPTLTQMGMASGFFTDGCDYGAALSGGLADCMSDANITWADFSTGTTQNDYSCVCVDVDSGWLAPLSGTHASVSAQLTPYVPLLPSYSVDPEVALPPIFFPPQGDLNDIEDGEYEYEYNSCGQLCHSAGVEYIDSRDTTFRSRVPQEVECIENLDQLNCLCLGILSEAELLSLRREQLRLQRRCCSDNTEPDEDHWSRKLTIALDLEGRSLGRKGSICIITLATYTTVYIIDMVLLGQEALLAGSALKRVLESQEIIKLMFDCRADCDALFFLYHVRLQNVCDLQISSCFALFPRARLLPGMKGVFSALGIFTEEDTRIKNAGRQLFNPERGGSFDRWEERPLTDALVQYCAVDVKYFFLAQVMLWNYIEQGFLLGEERLASVCMGTGLGNSRSNARIDFSITGYMSSKIKMY